LTQVIINTAHIWTEKQSTETGQPSQKSVLRDWAK